MKLLDTDLVKVKINGGWHYATGYEINNAAFPVEGIILIKPLKERLSQGQKGHVRKPKR